MLIEKDKAGMVDMLWHQMIDVESGILPEERYLLKDITLTLHKNPRMRGNEDLVYVPWAVTVRHAGKVILVVSIEQDDLRALAQSLGCSVRELQEERGTKGYFGEPRIVAYGGDKREDLGLYDEKMDLLGAKECLFEWALDIVDVVGEPKPLA
ncbi:MAG: hypothetical protein SPF89_12225 [Sphaerochaetaceae bacterium]|nr:hypothetical protein [Spirochaetales bacterium]MDY5500860.1 hypothetical protein [Sphaerochaetaceae bacterium]